MFWFELIFYSQVLVERAKIQNKCVVIINCHKIPDDLNCILIYQALRMLLSKMSKISNVNSFIPVRDRRAKLYIVFIVFHYVRMEKCMCLTLVRIAFSGRLNVYVLSSKYVSLITIVNNAM